MPPGTSVMLRTHVETTSGTETDLRYELLRFWDGKGRSRRTQPSSDPFRAVKMPIFTVLVVNETADALQKTLTERRQAEKER